MSGGCYGSVLLDKTLWQPLTAMNGRDVPWVHGCVLDHGHNGDHGAPAYPLDEEPQQWLRWPDNGPARLEAVEPSPPRRQSSPPTSSRLTRNAVGDQRARTARRRRINASPADSQIAALWAIAAAVERLADAVDRLGNPLHDKGTHRAANKSQSFAASEAARGTPMPSPPHTARRGFGSQYHSRSGSGSWSSSICRHVGRQYASRSAWYCARRAANSFISR